MKYSLTVGSVDMFAVIGRGLFYEVAPSRFGTLGKALFTLFQLITLDDWFYMYSDVVAKSPGGNPVKFVLSLFLRRVSKSVVLPTSLFHSKSLPQRCSDI